MSEADGLRLGVNLDHVATIRQARYTAYPDIAEALRAVQAAGADGITMHLREDRRHIQLQDVFTARDLVTTTLNLEMAATEEMVGIAIELKPDFCCIVPEQREELTTEGGLDLFSQPDRLIEVCRRLAEAGIQVSLFIEPEPSHIDRVSLIGAPIIELHTGAYANATGIEQKRELARVQRAAHHAHAQGIRVHAGHGLHYANVAEIAGIPEIRELNIGHAIVARALFVGLEQAVGEMKARMLKSRSA